ncbi:MAG: hypothetical protein ACLRT5_03570 [Lachnospiraceae bacterium]
MLAIKTILADKDETETLIFDEIDTGISGRTAQKVSEKMAVIGRSHQVICITHLPQIAAMADEHFEIVEKVEKGNHHQNFCSVPGWIRPGTGPYAGRRQDHRQCAGQRP